MRFDGRRASKTELVPAERTKIFALLTVFLFPSGVLSMLDSGGFFERRTSYRLRGLGDDLLRRSEGVFLLWLGPNNPLP